jgi:ABC-type multidrug transport system permease subunit
MFKEIVLHSRKIIKFSICLLILLIILDVISTYIGIKYVNAYEANEKTAYLFKLFGMLLPSGLKILTALLLGFITKIIWENSEFIIQNGNGLGNSLAIISVLNIMFIVIFLNFVYFLIIVNNINIIYN